MSNQNAEIGNKLEEIRKLLDIEQQYADEKVSIDYAWYVGATGYDENGVYTDFSDMYIKENRWENRWDDKFKENVQTMKPGDRIALKASYTRRKGLPFDNNDKTVSVMSIKAIGTITENIGDGKNIKVSWDKMEPVKEWYGPGVLRTTLHYVAAAEGYVKRNLLEFTFNNGIQDYSICEEQYREQPELIDEVDEKRRKSDGENVLLYGVPGSGKSWTIEHEYCDDEACMERLVFHPDYMYSDFVGQILPVVKKDDTGTEKVRYEFVPGPFTKLLKRAHNNPEKSYYLVIEEINRGNAPAIFGEVFQLLDRMPADKFNKDGSIQYKKCTSEYGITNANIAKEVYGDEDVKVRIPANMSIIGTMNTSDQNVFTLDTAFQRRWIMRMIPNSFENHKYAENPILDTGISWRQFCEAINEEVLRRNNVTSSEDKRLGAYFIAAEDLELLPIPEDVSEIERKKIEHHNARFAEKVLKYLWDDAFKFSHQDTFDTKNYKSLEKIIEGFMKSNGKNRFRIYHENLRKMIIEGVNKDGNQVSEE